MSTQRSVHVTIAAITILVLCAASLVWTLPWFITSLRALSGMHNRALLSVSVEDAMLRGALVGLAIWGIAAAVGLLRTRPHALGSATTFSLVTFVFSGTVLFFAGYALVQSDGHESDFVVLLPALVPLWWLILFLQPGVRRQFHHPHAPTAASGEGKSLE